MLNQNKLFITSTDTGVGKSIFTAFLALYYLSEGKNVAISKPIQTGNPKDTDFLKALTGKKIPIFNSYSFDLPAAPSVAAAYENKTIEIEKIISDIRNLEKEFDVVIVEGIGGIAVPIAVRCHPERSEGSLNVIRSFVADAPQDDIYLVADLINVLNYPIIIICRPSLGTINHTVLTIEFAKQRGLNILGFVISGYDETTNDTSIKTAPLEIEKITNVPCIMKFPKITEVNHNSLVEALRATPLLKI